jgi:hypothetical protein
MAAFAPTAMMPVAAAYTSPDTPSMPPTFMTPTFTPIVVPAAPVVTAVIDQFDLGLAAIVRDLGCLGIQLVQYTTCVGHAGNRVDRPDSRGHRSCAGKTQNAGEECSSIHRNLQSKSAPRQPSSRQWLNGS